MSPRDRKKSAAKPPVQLVPRERHISPELETDHPAQWSRSQTRTIVVTSGKGGVGKSNLSANLALALSERGARVVLVDGDLAQANLDLLLGMHPRYDIQHVLDGQKTLDEIVVNGPNGLRLIPAASGNPELADLDDFRREKLLRSLGTLDGAADIILIDTASGVSKQTTEFCRAGHDVLVVTTPEMTAFSDAYALVKVLQKQGGLAKAPRFVINMATTPEESEDTIRHMRVVARRFLRLDLDCLAVIPYDACVPRAVRLQEAVLTAFPKSPASAAYRALAAKLWKPVPPRSPESVDVPELTHRLEA